MLCIARTMLSQDVCPSVCVSVTRRYSVETANHILKFFSPSGSHTIPVFSYQTVWVFILWGPSQRQYQMQVVWKKSSFSTSIPLYLGNDRTSYYGMRIGNRIQAFKWYVFQWPWTQISRSCHSLMLNIAETVREREWNTNRELHTPTQLRHFKWPWVT